MPIVKWVAGRPAEHDEHGLRVFIVNNMRLRGFLVPDRTAKASTDDTRPIIPSNTFPTSAGHKIWICPHQQLAPHSPVAK